MGLRLQAEENEVLRFVSGNLLVPVSTMLEALQVTFQSRCSES